MPGQYRPGEPTVIGEVSGYDIELTPHIGYSRGEVTIRLIGVPSSQFTADREVLTGGGVGLVQRIENRASGIPTYLDNANRRLADAERTIRDADERIGAPFRHAQALREAEARLATVTQQLAELQDERPEPAEPEPAAGLNGSTPPRPRPAPLAAFGQRTSTTASAPSATR